MADVVGGSVGVPYGGLPPRYWFLVAALVADRDKWTCGDLATYRRV